MGYDPTQDVVFDMAAGRGGTKIPPNRPEMYQAICQDDLEISKKFRPQKGRGGKMQIASLDGKGWGDRRPRERGKIVHPGPQKRRKFKQRSVGNALKSRKSEGVDTFLRGECIRHPRRFEDQDQIGKKIAHFKGKWPFKADIFRRLVQFGAHLRANRRSRGSAPKLGF
jgi:hypothetical protein